MSNIGIGIVGGGYMGKAHAVAMAAVGAVFETGLRPVLEVVSASSFDPRPISANNASVVFASLLSAGGMRIVNRSLSP